MSAADAAPDPRLAERLRVFELLLAQGLITPADLEGEKERLAGTATSIACPRCRAAVSASSPACFNCGAALEVSTPATVRARRGAAVLPALLVVLIFVALNAVGFLIAQAMPSEGRDAFQITLQGTLGVLLFGVLFAMSGRWRVFRVMFALGALGFAALAFDSPRGTAESTGAPRAVAQTTQAPTVATAPPGPRAVTYRADQLIIPPEQFPFPGYRVESDYETEADGWAREFTAPAGSDHAYLHVSVSVAPVGFRYAPGKCDSAFTEPLVSTSAPAGPKVGEHSIVCRYELASGVRVLSFDINSRNVTVFTSVRVFARGDESAALERIVTLARQQLAIIDRISPP